MPDSALGASRLKRCYDLRAFNIEGQPNIQAEFSYTALMATPLKCNWKEDDGWFFGSKPRINFLAWVDSCRRMPFKWQDDWILDIEHQKWSSMIAAAMLENCEGKEMVSDLCCRRFADFAEWSSAHVFHFLPDKRKGWVSKSQSQLWNWDRYSNTILKLLINTASNMVALFMGRKLPSGIGCSGLLKTIFYLMGRLSPWCFAAAINEGELIDVAKNWEKLRSADLFSYGEKATEEKKKRVVT